MNLISKFKKNKILIIFILYLFLLIPYEIIFSTIQKRSPFFGFLFGTRTIDIEPQPFRFIANLHYKFLYENDLTVLYLLPVLFLALYLNHKLIKNSQLDTKPNLGAILISFSPYLFLNYIFYTNVYFYCFFSQPDFISGNCEEVDYFLYVSVLLLIFYIGVFKVNYVSYSNRTNKVIFTIYLLVLLFNLKGLGYLNNYLHTEIYVDYQDLFNLPSISIFIILLIVKYFKFEDNVFRAVIFSICTGLFFKSIFIFILSLLLNKYLVEYKKSNLQKNLEDLFIFYLLVSITLSTLTFPGGQDEHDLINEFYSLAKMTNFSDYFPQYNLLTPIFFKGLILKFKKLIFDFGLFMALLNFFSLGLLLYNLRRLTKNNFFISGIFFLSFSIFISSNGLRVHPNQEELLNGDFIVGLSYFQNTPLKLIFYSIFSTLFLSYLNNKKYKVYKILVFLCLLIATIDNLYIGFSLTLAFLGTDYFSNYDLKTLKKFFINNFLPITSIFIFSFIFYSKKYLKNLFIYYDSSFREGINLNFSYSGFHIVLLFVNMFIFLHTVLILKQTVKPDDKIKYQYLIFNTFVTFFYFIYFLGRSHPYNLYFVLFPFTIVCSLYLSFIIKNKNLSGLSFLIVLLMSNSIYQLYVTPNILNYYDNILFEEEISLKYLDFDTGGEIFGYIEVPTYLSQEIIENIKNDKVLILGKYGSIIAHLNGLNGHSPIINPVIVSELQCFNVKTILEKQEYSKVLISKSPFIYEYAKHTNCFQKTILPMLEDTRKYSLLHEEDFYKVYSK